MVVPQAWTPQLALSKKHVGKGERPNQTQLQPLCGSHA